MLKGSAAISALGLTACGGSSGGSTSSAPSAATPPTPPVTASAGSGVHPIFGTDLMTRQANSIAIRTAAAQGQADTTYGTQDNNGDEGLYADYRGSYSKGLPHNELGEVDTDAFDAFLLALETGQNRDFEAIPLGGTRKLVGPQGAYRYELVGLDSHNEESLPVPPGCRQPRRFAP